MSFNTKRLNRALCSTALAVVPISIALSGCAPKTDARQPSTVYADDRLEKVTWCAPMTDGKQLCAVSEYADNRFEKGQELVRAASLGAVKNVELLIANGADVNAKDIYDRTALMRAAKEGHKEIAKLLIANGANVNARDMEGGTALWRASLFGHKEIAELLIVRGADVNAKDNYGYTALMEAAYFGYTEIAELLITKGANVNANDNHGETALMLTSDPIIVELLKQHGAK